MSRTARPATSYRIAPAKLLPKLLLPPPARKALQAQAPARRLGAQELRIVQADQAVQAVQAAAGRAGRAAVNERAL